MSFTSSTKGWLGFVPVLALLVITTSVVTAEDSVRNDGQVTQAEYEKLKSEVENLRQKLATSAPVGSGSAVDRVLENKYGPNAGVTTRQGRLTIGGLLQVWFYTIQNDNRSWVDADQVNGGPNAGFGSNEVSDNDSFRVRRSQLRFTMDIHENVTAVVMINPAAEADSFPTFGSNQGNGAGGVVYVNSGVVSNDDANGFSSVAIGNVRNTAVRTGSGSSNRMLEDAYINYHGILPHHDVTVGQFLARAGEEGVRDDSRLDFVERAMITQVAYNRDLGMQVHGTWFDDRLQYWLGIFDGAGTAFQAHSNRSDTNDDKDWVLAILGRPIWKDETWGSLELGYSIRYGQGGESGSRATGRFARQVDGLNRHTTVHMQQFAWAMYKPGGPVRGWWLRGEWGHYRDRFAPNEVNSVVGDAVTDPPEFSIQGWYLASGYKMSESRWADDLCSGGIFYKSILSPMEFTFRYEAMENLFYQDPTEATPLRRMDIFKTQIYTAGVNYYIKGHNAKLQFNYNWVIEDDDNDSPSGAGNFAQGNGRQTREVSNNNFVVNFQVAW
jgi:hypothetical protein